MLVRSGDPQWAQVDTATRTLDVSGQALDWRATRLRGSTVPGQPAERLVVWQSYWIDGRWVASDVRAKVLTGYHRLLGHGDDGAIVVVYAREGAAGDAQAQAQIEAFLRDNLVRLNKQLGVTRDGAR